jgi:hypothetical protein
MIGRHGSPGPAPRRRSRAPVRRDGCAFAAFSAAGLAEMIADAEAEHGWPRG